MFASESAQSDKEWGDALSEGLLLVQAGLIKYPTGFNLSVNKATAPPAVAQAPRRPVNTFSNDQTPINRIPVELLTHIFAFCALVDPISRLYIWEYRKACLKPGWLNLTYVCTMWRRVALNYPTLWASHATNEFGTRWMQAMLERSKRAPVSLRVDLNRMMKDKDGRPGNQAGWPETEGGAAGDEDDEPSIKDSGLIAGHLSHISEIIITKLPPVLHKDQFDFLRLSAPMLASMRIDVPTHSDSCVSYTAVPTLPDDFVSQAPRLHRLHLYEYFPPLTRPVSQTLLGLEHLHVTFCSLRRMKNIAIIADGPEARSFINWSQVLNSMKKLKTLFLKYCLPLYTDSTSTDNVVFEFPDLQSLEIEDEVRDCGAFLQRLRIPAAAQVSIHCDTQDRAATFGEGWWPVVSFVHAHLNTGSSPIQALSLTVPDATLAKGTPTFNAVVWRSHIDFPAAPCPKGFALALKLTFSWFYSDENGNPTAPFLHPFMQALDTSLLASVHTAQFELQGTPAWNLMHVAPVLRHTQAIETLCIAGPDSGHTAVHLLHPQSNGGAHAQLAHALPLPALKTLILWKADLGAILEWREEDVVHVRLRAYLQAREAVQGHSLTLCIRECAMKPNWWAGLHQVADGSWDGRDVKIYTRNFLPGFPHPEIALFALA